MAERLRESYPAYLGITATDEAGVVRCATMPIALGAGDRRSSPCPSRPGNRRLRDRRIHPSAGTPIDRPCPLRCPTATRRVFRPASSPRCSIWAGWRTILPASRCPPGPPSPWPTGTASCSPACPRCPARSVSPCPSAYLPLLESGGTAAASSWSALMASCGCRATCRWRSVRPACSSWPASTRPQPWPRSMGPCGAPWGFSASRRCWPWLRVWWGARRYIRDPVRALVAATERWRDGDYTARANLRGGGSELVALGRAFDAMAESLEAHDRAREEAHAAARKVAEVFGCMTDSVFEVDRDWRITFMNERARIEVAQGQDQVGMNLWEAYPEGVNSSDLARVSPGHGRAGADRGRGLLPAAPEMVPGPRLPVARGPGLLWPGRHRTAAASRRIWSASGRCWRPSSRARPIPIFAKDREGRYITLNSAAARVHRTRRDTTVIGLTDADVFPPEIAAALRDQELRIMETGATEVLEETDSGSAPRRDPGLSHHQDAAERFRPAPSSGSSASPATSPSARRQRRNCAGPRRRPSAPTWQSPSSWRRPATTCASPFSP